MRERCRKVFRLLGLAGIFVLVICTGKDASAAESARLRIIATTDLHNQVNDNDYDQGSKNRTKSLAKLSTMIKNARAEVPEGNSITVDVGDSFYGYSTEMILNDKEKKYSVQPIYKAMKCIGYDAITLGNHDFDYGDTFIANQIKDAGFSDICLVANVKNLKTNTYPWKRSKILTKTLTTSSGSTIDVKVGIIGVTKAELSTYYNYTTTLYGESILKTVRTEASALKKKGADFVLVLAHTGMGMAKATDADDEVGYAISKIKDVDCVMLGHQHRNYPSDEEATRLFYELPNTDRKTGLTNGKPVVMVADHADGIGIINMEVDVQNGKPVLVGSSTEVRKCSVIVEDDPVIMSATDEHDPLIQTTYNQMLADVDPNAHINSYFGLLEDNYALQLNNEAKIQYGLQFINSKEGAAYANCHVIAATRFYLDGSEGKDDYFKLNDTITMKDILNIQQYQHNNNYAYMITGKQLKEWMEWSSSIFAQQYEKITSDALLETLMSSKSASSVVSDEWINNWGPYAIFDGVEYTIDTTKPARYNAAGQLIHADSNRITQLTYNGEPVTDSTKLVLVENYVSANRTLLAPLYNQRLSTKGDRTADALKAYVSRLGMFGPISNQADNNWKLQFGTTERLILRSSADSEMEAGRMPWYDFLLKTVDEYNYYLVNAKKVTADNKEAGPLLVVSSTNTKPTNRDITIKAQASDAAGLDKITYLPGQHAPGDEEWNTADVATNGAVTVSQNGIYSFCARDKQGRTSYKNIRIDNIDKGILEAPTIDKFNNKKTIVTGDAQANVTVYIKASGKMYQTKTKKDGSYQCTIAKQTAGKIITAYVKDSKGRKSAASTTVVLRKGPNTPTFNPVSNKSLKLTGKLNDSNATVVLYIDKDVYVPKSGGKDLYKNSVRYTSKRKIRTMGKYSVKNGKYEVEIPVQLAKKKITLFSVDTKGRCSLLVNRTVSEAAPNKPKVNTVCDAENYVTGSIPDAKHASKVTVTVRGKRYHANSNASGKYIVRTNGVKAGDQIQVTATDNKNGTARTSLKATQQVVEKKNYQLKKEKSKLQIKTVSTRTTEVTGKNKSDSNLYLNYGTNSEQICSGSGTFRYELKAPLKGGSKLYFVRRSKGGTLQEVKEAEIVVLKPEKPVIQEKKLSKKTKQITVLAKERAVIVANAKGKHIEVTKCSYSAKKKRYVYRVKIPKGTKKVSCYMENDAGKSEKTSIVLPKEKKKSKAKSKTKKK